MGGAVAIVVALLVFPVVVALSGALGAAVLGALVKRSVDEQHAGSELLEVNR
jgi:hypothetical protein